MAPKLRPRKGRNKKGTSEGDPLVLDSSSKDVEIQDAPRDATSPFPQATGPPSGLLGSSLSSHNLSLQSPHNLGREPPPAQTSPSRRRSSPSRFAPSASSAVDIANLRPKYAAIDNDVGHPPGYVRRPGPTLRQSGTTNWVNGVLSGGALIRLLEDLSRSSQTEHRQVCIWLGNFVARFGRIHNPDGLIVTKAQDMHMLMLAHGLWLEFKGIPAKGDILWVPGLEPTENDNPAWESRAKDNLPELPRTYSQKHWTAGEAQYFYGTSTKRPRKGMLVCEKWIDSMGWERTIWQA